MPIDATSSSSLVTLTRTLNSLHLAALDAARIQEAQAIARVRRVEGDRSASRQNQQLRDDHADQVTKNSDINKSAAADDAAHASLSSAQALALRNGNGPSLASLVPAKPQLSPTDELALFAETSGQQSTSRISADAQAAHHLLVTINPGQAVAQDGEAVNVDIIAPRAEQQSHAVAAQVLTLTTRAQAATAALYARNADVVFDSYPLSQIAA